MFFHLGNKQDGSPIDLYRDTPVRLLGYANELGESFKYLISRPAYLTTYGVAIAYVLADTFDKTKRAERRQQWKVALDTLGWQMLASVAIPGLVINRVVWTTRRVMQERQLTNKLLPTYLGLACIPLIVTPIDRTIDWLFDNTIRKQRDWPKSDPH
ncbi:Mitochondrial fission process protein 1 [Perkinsus olseni]|uniref:Mitochondrial fission process protein 1 n=1 Tax=Perkinsus olseni TaxID=32597 RepID=A0A7J6M542_PEROL|nr:Mitochondrial fission process protein 1 [Perkinsus olseni]KAF4671272.1 Mitochondrial fission process protein 1 [Perkinsus olseni]